MILPIDEKEARYRVINLMMDGKFREAENLLTVCVSRALIQRSYADFYYQILDTIRKPRSTASNAPAAEASLKPAYFSKPDATAKTIDMRRLKFVANLGAQIG